MIVRTEFASISTEITANIKCYQKAIKETMELKSLDAFLRLVLQLGNFINTVSKVVDAKCTLQKFN